MNIFFSLPLFPRRCTKGKDIWTATYSVYDNFLLFYLGRVPDLAKPASSFSLPPCYYIRNVVYYAKDIFSFFSPFLSNWYGTYIWTSGRKFCLLLSFNGQEQYISMEISPLSQPEIRVKQMFWNSNQILE